MHRNDSTHFLSKGQVFSAIASHLLGQWKRLSKDEVPVGTQRRDVAGSLDSQPSATYSCIHSCW